MIIKPPEKYYELPKRHRLVILKALEIICQKSGLANTQLGAEKTQETMIGMMNDGTMRLVKTPRGVGVALYDFVLHRYKLL